MRRHLIILVFALLLAGGRLYGQAPVDTAPTSIDSAKWLIGQWQNEAEERLRFEEQWSAPAVNSMMGMFRLHSTERVLVYEFMLIEQREDGVWLRLLHFRPGLEAVEERALNFKLVEATAEKLVFENPDANNKRPQRITYERKDGDRLVASVETEREGQPTTLTLRFRRPPKP